ncbi:hypothetical protein EDD99_4499 [Streptomyces sp. 846.5]|nr:hypothetical protein [Streptomyces sp. 846.5]TDU05958.1 hypothetical protein EDD99_4499 [Streptomyces sp. 846.5]
MSTRGEAAGGRDAVAASLLRTLDATRKYLDEAKGEAEQARKDLSRAEDRTASLVGLQTRVGAELDRVTKAWETCCGLHDELVELCGAQDAPDDGPRPPGAETQEPVEITGARSIALMRMLKPAPMDAWALRPAAASVARRCAVIARRAGLSTRHNPVRVRDVTAWYGRTVLARTGSLPEVARALGLTSLDAAAAAIGYPWQDQPAAGAKP